MSPNQPKTPVTSFRLSDEDKARIERVAAQMQTTATEAVRRLARAADDMAWDVGRLTDQIRRNGWDPNTFPIEAYHAGLLAYRESMNVEGSLPSETAWAVRDAIAAAWPTICESKIEEERRHLLADVITRLEGFQVDDDVIAHFVRLLDS